MHLFAKKKTTHEKGTRSRDPLTQNVDLCLDSSIRKAATATGDSKDY